VIKPSYRPQIIWIYSGSLALALDSATWLDTTAELRRMGWQITLIAMGLSGLQNIHGTEVFCIPTLEVYFLRQLVFHMRLLKEIQRQWSRVDIILFHQISAPWIFPLRLIRALSRQKRPLFVLDIRSLHMPPRGKQSWQDWLREQFNKFIIRSSNYWIDGYLAITQRMAEVVKISPKKLMGVWPSGVNLDQYSVARNSRIWPLKGETIHIIYVGSLHYERNLMALCRAVEQANKEGLNFKFTLVGEGTEKKDLEKFSASTNSRITTLKPVPHGNIPEILSRAHIGALPFPDEEKFKVSSPIKLFEYMAAGLPIFATKITCHTDVIGDGKYAFWAEDASEQGLLNALHLIWRSRNLLSEMGQKAALAAPEWTWAMSAEKLRKSLEKGFLSYKSPLENNPRWKK
jgi:glycosyltransferase involved in cell wall biosynthesis